jgi:acyl transferase domain-containing protein
MTSSRSRCATFTNEADGYVPSEGVVTFILKTSSAAMRDKNEILAYVKSSTIKHDGRSQGMIAPNGKAQVAMQQELLQHAEVLPSQIE